MIKAVLTVIFDGIRYLLFIENFILITVNLRESDNPVSMVIDLSELLDLFVMIKSMQEGFCGFLTMVLQS